MLKSEPKRRETKQMKKRRKDKKEREKQRGTREKRRENLRSVAKEERGRQKAD